MYTMNIRNKYSNEEDCLTDRTIFDVHTTHDNLTDWKCKYNDS